MRRAITVQSSSCRGRPEEILNAWFRRILVASTEIEHKIQRDFTDVIMIPVLLGLLEYAWRKGRWMDACSWIHQMSFR